MASLQIVLNKVYFSRYSWVGFVKKLSSIFVSNASSSCNKWQVEKANVAHPDTLARQCARKDDCEVCNMAQVMSMTLLQCAVSGSSSHRAEQELVDRGRFCWTLSAFLSTQKSAQKSKNTQKSAFEGKFTLLSAQKSDQKSGFAQKKAQMSSFTQKRAQMSGSLKKSAQERRHSKE